MSLKLSLIKPVPELTARIAHAAFTNGNPYRGLGKTHWQHLATAAAINLDRLFAWLTERPRTATRTSHFAALAP